MNAQPVPPGFENESRSAQIRPVIDRYKSGALVGLEHTVEVYSAKDKEPFYMCLLCEKRGDPRTIFSHWISFNHRMKYLEKYFPTVSQQLNSYKYPDPGHNNLAGAIQIIVDAIEKRYGRLYPFSYEKLYYQRNRDSITDDIEESEHFDERRGETFVSFIDRKLLEPSGGNSNSNKNKFSKDPSPPIVKPPVKRLGPIKVTLNTKSLPNESLDAISSEEENGGGRKKMRDQSPAYRVTPRVHRSPPFDEPTAKKDNLKEKNPFPTPRELSLQAGQIAQEKYKWEKYRCSAELAEKELVKKLKEFEKNPEKHPMYPEEWKKFWNRRYKELQQQKKDPNNYDYKPEWIVFWTRRMKELHDKDLEKKRVEIKLKLGLDPDSEEKTDALKSQYKVDNPKKQPDLCEQVIDISDEEENFLELNSKRRPQRDIGSRDRASKDRISRERASRDRSSKDRRDTKERDIRKKRRSLSRSLSPLSEDSDSSYRRKKKDSHRSRSRSRSRSISRDRAEWDRKYAAHPYPYPPYARGFPPMYARPPLGYPPYGAPYRPPYSKYPKYEEYEEDSKSPIPESRKKEPPVKEEEPESDEPLTVVAVLRLLTALEDYLGSLGPKVVDMLGKALALEKIRSNSSDDLLINEDNCVFFETIKEKLKGQLLANVLDDQLKIKAIKKAIKNIAGIIFEVNRKATKKENSDPNDSTEKEKPPNVPKTAKKISDLPFERSVVSSKLAAALVTEGKEDVSTDDMDKLIFLLILMVKLSKGATKNVNSKEICEFLKIKRAPSPSPTPPKQVIDMFSKEEIESMKMVVNAKEKEVRKEDESSNDEPKETSGASGLDCLTDSDLQTLLQNFKHLSSEEQHHLIAHLKKLESTDPLRVEKLRKYVNISEDEKSKKASFDLDDDDDDSRSRSVGYSNRDDSPPPPPPCKPDSRKINISDDEDDEDYNFEDVVKSINASNLQPKQVSSNPPRPSTSNAKSSAPISITDTQNLIANLMGSLSKTGNPQPPQPPQQKPPPPQPPSSMPYYQQTAQSQQQFISYPHLNPQQQQMNANAYYNYYQQQQQQPQQMNYNNAYNMAGYPQQGMPPNFNMFNQNMNPMNNGRGGPPGNY